MTSRLESLDAEPRIRRTSHRVQSAPNFDRIARAYQWLEYLTLGKALEHVRYCHLDAGRLDQSTSALVLGDGDGRFTARLMQRHPTLKVTAVDASRRMLDLLQRRCEPFAQLSFAQRLSTFHTDARTHPAGDGVDLVVTHFFLDCLSDDEVQSLIVRLKPALRPGTLWLVSEFKANGIASRSLVRSLYLAFRILTGLRITSLPHHAEFLRAAGFHLLAEETGLGGILATEVWILP